MPTPTPPPHFHGAFPTDFPTRAAYSEGAGPYRIIPQAVAIPSNVDDLCALVRHTAAQGGSLIPRGAGSGLPGNNVGPGTVVDLREFASPLVVSAKGYANVGAAVTWAALDRAAHQVGLRLGPNPSSGAFCTLGGMVATNASGARTLRSGSIRCWVRGVELVTAEGEVGWFARSADRRPVREAFRGERRGLDRNLAAIQRFQSEVHPDLLGSAVEIEARFPQTRKNSSGYALDRYLATGDLLDLLIGSEGTLGLITRIELDLEPVPKSVSSALLAIADLGELPEVIRQLIELEPAAIELMDRTLLEVAGPGIPFVVGDVEAVLLVDFERKEDGAAEAAIAKVRTKLGSRCPFLETAISPEDRERLWTVRHAASPALASLPPHRRSLQIIEDGCVPLAALGRYIQGVRAAARRAGLEIVAFGHAGDGHLHVNVLADTRDDAFPGRIARLLDDVTGLVAELRGTTSGEHGDGRLRAPLLYRLYGPKVMKLFEKVKQAFDPAGIFNPGVIVPTPGSSPITDLKVGSGTPPIPPEIEERLRTIERTAAWNIPKTDLVSPGVAPT
ncbi:MAG: FAD-binding oxidoreductase [Gemmatimonadetes bacterium]|nr:FAD-binding oxidoreductase [Gemmatimonadota bacterium]